jgi:AraC-like DNA-binding protein
MMSSSDLRTSIERLIKYLRLISDAVAIRLDEASEGTRVTIDFVGGTRPVPRQRREYGLLMMLSLCRWILGGTLNPAAASFAGPRPDDLTPYRAVLRCPLTFGAACDSFTIGSDDLARSLPTSMPSLFSLHERIARLRLERLQKSDMGRRVQEAVEKRLQDGTPLRAQIAADLHTSDHTLQRRLAQEKTSFDQLVEGTRRQLATQLLADEGVSFVDITFMLGYADERSFFRACSRWFGSTPGEVRARVRTASA